MVKPIEIDALFYQIEVENRVLIDVRTPAEFEKGHIPNAINLPLFTNEERVVVGTIYKQQSPEKALLKGLDFVGNKMSGFIKKVTKLAPEKKIIFHCWRGGKRSGSMAWLLDMAGFDVMSLKGGYKSYRHFIQKEMAERAFDIVILGGKTGAGKTHILHILQKNKIQVVDLEGLAHHKGSAFGTIGEAPQPSNEQFENNVYEAFRNLDNSKKIWVENESRSIGKVAIPEVLWQKMRSARLIDIEIPFDSRVTNLVIDYTNCDKNELIEAFKKIERKLGGQQLKKALEALDKNDFATAAGIALYYYDKTYQHCLDKKEDDRTQLLKFETGDKETIVQVLLKYDKY